MDTFDYASDRFAPPQQVEGLDAIDSWGHAMGARLRAIRLERDLTQQAVADMANLSVSAVSRIERGERPPTIRILRKLSSVLHIDLGELLGVKET